MTLSRMEKPPAGGIQSSFEETLLRVKNLLRPHLKTKLATQNASDKLHRAMEYSLGEGKCLRPFLVFTFAQINESQPSQAILEAAVALEMIHTYSLIHDDLPAMDNSDMRHGKPTCWRAFDAATATLAGDALLTYAFEVLSELPQTPASTKIALVNLYAKATGANGMVGGQMMDIFPKAGSEHIKKMQLLKTGAILVAACEAGVILSGDMTKQPLAREFGEKLGLAFQITDDFMDLRGNSAAMGKATQTDATKITFITELGAEKATAFLEDLLADLDSLARKIQPQGGDLPALAAWLRVRDH